MPENYTYYLLNDRYAAQMLIKKFDFQTIPHRIIYNLNEIELEYLRYPVTIFVNDKRLDTSYLSIVAKTYQEADIIQKQFFKQSCESVFVQEQMPGHKEVVIIIENGKVEIKEQTKLLLPNGFINKILELFEKTEMLHGKLIVAIYQKKLYKII